MQPGFVQNFIHHLEVGTGARYLRLTLLAVVVLTIGVLYDIRSASDFAAPEAMDSAQVARNLAEGKGYSTDCIRPFGIYLLQKHNGENASDSDPARLKSAHPDLANAPVYPTLIAGLMKILPFRYAADTKSSFWSDGTYFQRYQPEFIIMLFNQILLLVAAGLTFFLANELFDVSIAWLSALLVLCCEELWQFSTSGLSTILLLNIFLALTFCLLRIEKSVRGEQPKNLFLFAASAGALVGIGALTRYSFGWTIFPVVAFLMLFGGQKKSIHAAIAFGAFLVFLMPWVVRNEIVSGTAFGTAGYAILENSPLFPKFQLERSLHPDFGQIFLLKPYLLKLLAGVREIFSSGLPKLGGSWASILFLAGLLLGFRRDETRRIRYFLLMCLGVFIFVQAMGRTALADETPEINSENLLVLFAPLAFVYGVGFFFTLLDAMTLPVQQLRYGVIGIFGALCCLPMFFSLLQKSSPLHYPPYYPPEIQTVCGWMKPDELIMSDVPWAVAWYGNHQCTWLTLNSDDEFSAINHNLKAVKGIYFTTVTLDGKFLSEMARNSPESWDRFVLNVGTSNKFPPGFYLQTMKILSTGLFITDTQRWSDAN
ncbi:MAG TPA: glycosyltransferase family 39 protein [Verrucomicrobiae bacterium]|nr:glycosyltransferase family 39 protein [Verrucomicrobiae bacterium]